VNVVIAAVLFVALRATGQWEPVGSLGPASGSFLERLLLVNLFLVAFNLIPAFPMDGGRVLRALLALRTDHVRATRIAAGIGQALAFVFGFVGLFGNPFLVFIALFVWIGAASESTQAQTRDALGGIPLRRVMLTEFRVLEPDDTLGDAVRLTLAGTQADFPVVSDGSVVGVLTQGALVRGLEEAGRDGRVADFMTREFETARSDEMALPVFHRLQKCRCRTIPVLENGHLHGLVTTENVGEFLRIRSALHD
jgi:CBS domain-containing protein